MTDVYDQAQHYDHLYRMSALNAQMQRSRKQKMIVPSTDCIGCGEEIEPARRRAVPNATRCVDCQTKHERRHS